MNHFQGASGERRKEPCEFRDFSPYEVSRRGLYKVWAQISFGHSSAWWASDYSAFRVERCDCFTRLRQGINLKLSGITKQARIIRGTRRKPS